MLFKPFDLAKWITLGFCAWLAGLGESGGGFHGGSSFNHGGHHRTGGELAEQFRHCYQQASDYTLANLAWLIPLVTLVVLLSVALGIVILWLNCRGKFMFLHNVALDKAEVEVPWKKFASAANSLFWFRLTFGVIGMILLMPLLIMIAVCIIRMVLQGEPDFAGVMTTIGFSLGFLALALVFGLIRRLMIDFVVPLMFLRGGSCLSAWSEFFTLAAAHGHRRHRLDGNPADLLHRGLPDGAAVFGNCVAAAGARVQARLSAVLPRAIRPAV